MSDDTPLYRRYMEEAQAFMSHWEGIVIVLMFSVLLGFSLAFLTTIYIPFQNVYPPESAPGFTVEGNLTATGLENNYTLACSTDPTMQRRGPVTCNYTFASRDGLTRLQDSGDPLLTATWWPFDGRNSTDNIMRIRTANMTSNFSFYGPKQEGRYILRLEARQPDGIEHRMRYTIPSNETTTFRVFTDRQELSILYRLLVLTFNIIVLTSIWFSAGEVAVELLERIDRKEADGEDSGY